MDGASRSVGIIMGSQSDWETMQHAAGTLERLGIGYEARIVSAQLLDASGEDLVAYAAKVVESCPYVKNEYPVPECVALDVLGTRAEKSPAAMAA